MKMPKVDKQDVMDQLVIAAKAYGLKGLANELDKPYSTLSNELAEREWGKMGLRTSLTIIEKCLDPNTEALNPDQARTAAINLLDLVDNGFNRVAYNIPEIDGYMVEIMRLISDLSVQYAEDISHLATAMEDGQWTAKEIRDCRKENRDLLTSCLQIEAYLDHLEQREANK